MANVPAASRDAPCSSSLLYLPITVTPHAARASRQRDAPHSINADTCAPAGGTTLAHYTVSASPAYFLHTAYGPSKWLVVPLTLTYSRLFACTCSWHKRSRVAPTVNKIRAALTTKSMLMGRGSL